jgi:hypothetical protein
LDIEQINRWIEEPLDARPEEIENRFFNSFENRRPDQITYNQLRQINIPEGHPGNQLHGLVEEFGIEILAYYIPFHFHRPDRPWGIYLRRVGIDHVRQRLMEIAGRDGHNFRNLEIPTNVAEHILLLHELRHHAIEVAFTRVELRGNTRNEYQRYIARKRNHNNISSDTEAICNANVATHSSIFKTDWERPRLMPPTPPNVIIKLDLNDYVRTFMIGQPAGYRDFARFTGFSSAQTFEHLQLPIEHRLDLPQIEKEFKSHSDLSTLSRLPVPIRVV